MRWVRSADRSASIGRLHNRSRHPKSATERTTREAIRSRRSAQHAVRMEPESSRGHRRRRGCSPRVGERRGKRLERAVHVGAHILRRDVLRGSNKRLRRGIGIEAKKTLLMQSSREVLVPGNLFTVEHLMARGGTPERPEQLSNMVVEELLVEGGFLLFGPDAAHEDNLELADFFEGQERQMEREVRKLLFEQSLGAAHQSFRVLDNAFDKWFVWRPLGF